MEWIPAKTLLSGYVESNPWFGVNYNMNIYKGCNHGCIYCDSRSACYGVAHFDQVRAKENVLALLERELKSKRRTGVVGLGSMSDPYNPFEKQYRLTRGALERINHYGYGVAIATKSSLIERDIDLLKEISRHSPVLVKITITTADDALCRKIEPNVSLSSQRLGIIKKLSQEGIFVGILCMPVLPFIGDTAKNMGKMIALAHENGGKFIYPKFGVTLRENQREWYYDRLDQLFPSLKEAYIKTFGNSYECISPNAKALWHLFKEDCNRYGLLYKMDDIIMAYKTPSQGVQLSWF
ncbi:radical SAM superfamily protein [Anaerotignum neopropionicum]|uniref:Radical SAM superfamily protein n=1 Tax=Anaerotignum neopropionicum TaxID=36847 RepID=A0A136WFA2_9FIRM|nr:radical SAM protein [Anaerotignum neopropionicum]KXL53228.1 radical SAM superfamily protein [Anaerotignum neopropionicum]